MGKQFRVRSHQGLGLLAALAAVLSVPVMAQEATARPMTSVVASTASQVTEGSDQEHLTVDALRTSGTLAAVALTTAAVVCLWWYLVLRRRR